MERPLRQSLAKEAEMMNLWTQELEHVDRSETHEHENEIIDNEILNRNIPRGNRVAVKLETT